MTWVLLGIAWLAAAVYIAAFFAGGTARDDDAQIAADEEQMRALLRDAKDPLAGSRGWEEHA